MPARPSWPPTEHKLLFANIMAYGLLLVLVALFHQELNWAQITLRGYFFSGDIPPSQDVLLIEEAKKHHESGDDVVSIRYLQQALAINPYGEARFYLGLAETDDNKSLEHLAAFRAIDPSCLSVYVCMIKILQKKSEQAEIAKLLAEGIEHFRGAMLAYQPRFAPDVQEEFNFKAMRVHDTLQESLAVLEEMNGE